MTDASPKSANQHPMRHADVTAHVVNSILHTLRFMGGIGLVLWILYYVSPVTHFVFRDFEVEEPWYLQPTHAASTFAVVYSTHVVNLCLVLVVIYVTCMVFCRWRGALATLFDVLSCVLIGLGVAILISTVTAVQNDLMPQVALMVTRSCQ